MLGKQRGNSSSTSSSKNRTSTAGPSATSKLVKQQSGNISSGSPETKRSIPYVKLQDNPKFLPKYTAALQRSVDDSVQPDDLDAIQLELELLLSTVALRYRILKSEYEAVDKGIAEDRRDRDRKSKYLEKQPASPGKKKHYEDKFSKSKEYKYSSTSSSNKSSSKMRTMSNIVPSPAPSQQTDDSMDGMSSHGHQKDTKMSLPKNDAPSRFWLSVEPYCMPITQEDIKLIDDLIDEYSNSTLSPIPDLGPHYSTKWAAEDMKEEQDNSNQNAKGKRRFETTQAGEDVIGMVKNAEKLMGENITGPLTQRLVSALMEENLIQDPERNLENGLENQNNNNRTASVMKNGISIERRVRRELIEQGLLDPEDFKPGQDDEILCEIKRVRTELSAIVEHNCGELKRLQTAAREEIKRLEIKRKLDAVDQEIIETYKKVTAAKQKRRPLTKQERDEVFRLSEEQKRLTEILDSMPLPGNFNIESV